MNSIFMVYSNKRTYTVLCGMSKKGKETLSEMVGEEPSSFGHREASPAVLPNV